MNAMATGFGDDVPNEDVSQAVDRPSATVRVIPDVLTSIALRLTSADGRQLGMATLISPSLAITVDHVLGGQSTEGTELSLRLSRAGESSETYAGAWVLARDPSIDFAVLGLGVPALPVELPVELPDDLLSSALPAPGAVWDSLCLIPSVPLEGAAAWGTVGEPLVVDEIQHLQLFVEQVPTDVSGTSGAPIVVSGRLVGIVARGDSTNREWYAIPSVEMLASPAADAFQRAAVTVPADLDKTNFWARLSEPGRRALRRAVGLSTSRRQRDVHMEHLLAGLYEDRGGPTRQLLVAQGLEPDDLRGLVQQAVRVGLPAESLPEQPLDALPSVSVHVQATLLAALAAAAADRSPVVRSRHLLEGLLSVRNCTLVQALEQRGVTLDRLAEFLAPVPVRPVPLPRLRSDDPRDPEAKDHLGIGREVEALGKVIAAQDTRPPLAIGLFGDWGSGKSFFMAELHRWIEAIKQETRKAPGDTAYCPNVVQLWFNAWHYIDANLWACLTAEIFEQLAEALDRDQALTAGLKDPAAARAQLLVATASTEQLAAAAEERQRAAQARLRDIQQHLQRLSAAEQEEKLTISPSELVRQAPQFVLDQPEVKAKLSEARKALPFELTAEQTNQQLLELRGTAGLLYTLWRSIRDPKNRKDWIWLVVGAVLGGALFLGRAVWLPWPEQLGGQLAGWLSSLVAGLVAVRLALQPFLPGARRAMAFLRDARAAGARQIAERQQDERARLERERQRAEDEAREAQQTVTREAERLKVFQRQLEELRPDHQLSHYVRQRRESTDYTQHLGVISRARSDFERLSQLLAEVRKQSQQERRGQVSPNPNRLQLPRIDRIVLYIDDLDRCPENKVVEVLQAVHMLLALDLFIVVVGVDARWLLHSLKQHSKAFQTPTPDGAAPTDLEAPHWRSTPLNYLEKIFQIPFTLRPMERTGFVQLVDSMIGATLAAPQPSEASSANGRSDSPPTTRLTNSPGASEEQDSDQRKFLPDGDRTPPTEPPPPTVRPDLPPIERDTPTVSTLPPIDLNPDVLRLTEPESNFIKRLFPVIPSPRATNHFVNIYRVLRASLPDQDRAAFISESGTGQYRAALLLLALVVGYPEQASELLRVLLNERPEGRWWEFVFRAKLEEVEGRLGQVTIDSSVSWQRFREKLTEVRSLIPESQSCADFLEWAPRVARFSFQSGRVLLAERQVEAED